MLKLKYIETSKIFQFDGSQIGCAYFFNRFNDYTQKQNKLNVYCEYILLKNLLKSINIDIDKQTVIKTKHGKPFFKNLNIFFSISHSKNLVVAAISNHPIGIDVQAIGCLNQNTIFKIAQRYFSLQELTIIQKAKNPNGKFTKYWAKYESILKLHGSRQALQSAQNTNSTKVYSKIKIIKDLNNTKYYLCFSTSKHFSLDNTTTSC